MKVALLAPNVYGDRALATAVALADAGFPPQLIVSLTTANLGSIARKIAQQGLRGFVSFAIGRVLRRRGGDGGTQRPRGNLKEFCAARGIPLRLVGDVNSPESVAALRALAPDVIVYTGGGILRQPLIETARIGVLNAHSGGLPRYRGMSVTEWALLEGQPIATTLHFIDAGIDTGRILEVAPVEITPADESIAALTERITRLTVDQLVRGVAALSRGAIEPIPQRAEDGRQYFAMHESLRKIAELRLRRLRERA